MSGTEHRARIRAPEPSGSGGWINTIGPGPAPAAPRGRVVLLGFWTPACTDCHHMLDGLRSLEERHGDVLSVAGVLSARFPYEAGRAAAITAVQRHDVRHPVLLDPERVTASRYAVRSWPALALIDPEGYLVACHAGADAAAAMDTLIPALAAEHDAKGTLRPGPVGAAPVEAPRGDLRFPTKVLRLPSGALLVADTGRNSLAELSDDGRTVLRRIGTGRRGLVDGGPRHAQFAAPRGMALLPPEVASHVRYDVVVADTANHALRGVSLATGAVRTVAGTGARGRAACETASDADGAGAGPGAGVTAASGVDADGGGARATALSAPWDLAWFGGRIIVAMAGAHQLWEFDPVGEGVMVLAGTGGEGLADGPVEAAAFARPCGLSVSPDAHTLWIVDAGTSALRRLTDGCVTTVVGAGPRAFGHLDGPAAAARFQHPTGTGSLADGSVLVADTYNGALRRYDPVSDRVTTVLTGLLEPTDAAVVSDLDDELQVVVVESAAHRVRRRRVPATPVGGRGA